MSKCEASNIRFGDGSLVKSLGHGEYQAMAVVLGDEIDCDGEVYCPSMTEDDFDLPRQKWLPLHFAHLQDPKVGKKRFAKADWEFLPREGVKIRWRFDNPFDPMTQDIIKLCDEDSMAISSAAILTEKRKEAKFTRIVRWHIHECSLTGSACALSGRTRVNASKTYESLSFDELKRRSGMTEGQLLFERTQAVIHRALAALDRKCADACCDRCNHTDDWIRSQREEVIRFNVDKPEITRRRDIKITLSEAQERHEKTKELLAQAEKHLAECNTERARLNLGPGIPYRHFEDWLLAGQKSGFINHWSRFG